MIWNLRRTKEIGVVNWLWIMEFHRNGFPHFHLFIEVAIAGQGGMIGGDTLRHYWTVGRVMENHIFSKEHWNILLGYFEKHSYFGEGKEHQLELPDWAKGMKKRIRRWGAMIQPQLNGEAARRNHPGLGLRHFTMRSYQVILETCGQKTRVKVNGDMVAVDVVIGVPYWELRKKIPGNYVQGLGYVCDLDYVDLTLLAEMFDGFSGVLAQVVEQLEYWGEYEEGQDVVDAEGR